MHSIRVAVLVGILLAVLVSGCGETPAEQEAEVTVGKDAATGPPRNAAKGTGGEA